MWNIYVKYHEQRIFVRGYVRSINHFQWSLPFFDFIEGIAATIFKRVNSIYVQNMKEKWPDI